MKKSKIISFLIAALLIAVLMCITLLCLKNRAENKVDVVFFGDSVMAGNQDGTELSYYLGNSMGLSYCNAAFGGMSMAKIVKYGYAGEYNDLFTMAGLSEAVASGDFSLQIMASRGNSDKMVPFLHDTAVNVSKIDFDSVKYIFIEQGTNDYLDGVPIDNPGDKYDVYTYGGALRKSIENIKKGAPNAKIILVTPVFIAPLSLEGDAETADYGGGFLKDYVAAEKNIAAEYGLDLIDNFTEVDINKENCLSYLDDGIHPNVSGVKIIGDNILKRFKELR